MDIVVDMPLIRIDTYSVRGTLTVAIRVPEPRLLREQKERLTEPVTEITYKSPQFSLHWTIDWSERTYGTYRKGDYHGLIRWLDTDFSPKFVEEFKDLFEWYFKGGFLEEFLKLGDISIEVRSSADFVPNRTGWFFVTIETKLTITFLPTRPTFRFETPWLAEKTIIYNENRIPYILRTTADIILRQEDMGYENLHYTSRGVSEITFLFGDKQEGYERPPEWSFHLDYKTQSVDPKTIVGLFDSVKDVLEQNLPNGLTQLRFLIATLPPTQAVLVGDTELLSIRNELERERGEGVNFVLNTLIELEEVLREVGL